MSAIAGHTQHFKKSASLACVNARPKTDRLLLRSFATESAVSTLRADFEDT